MLSEQCVPIASLISKWAAGLIEASSVQIRDAKNLCDACTADLEKMEPSSLTVGSSASLDHVILEWLKVLSTMNFIIHV